MEDNNSKQREIDTNDSLAFFGAVTASVSHELNNVLAIMDQTTGLLEDRLAGDKQDIRIPAEKLEKIVRSLQHQAQRGLDLIKSLNRFAHSTDQSRQLFDVNQMLNNLGQLTSRLARLKGARLEIQPSNEPLNINSNPLVLQQAVFAAIKKVLSSAGKDDVISVTAVKVDDGAEIEVKGPVSPNSQLSADMTDIQRLIERLPGKVNWETTGQNQVFRLVVSG